MNFKRLDGVSPRIMKTATASQHHLAHLEPLSREEINQLPRRKFEGRIHVVDNDGYTAALAELRRHPVLGFDTESKPVFRKGESSLPALVQLASESEVYLFRLRQLADLHPLFSLLAEAHIVKAGVAVGDDILKLNQLQRFTPAGFLDLGEHALRSGMRISGVRSLAANFLGFRISKSARTSNWEREALAPAQIDYAATDAWVCLQLFHCFRNLAIL